MWLAPSEVLNAINPLTDCSIILFIITERLPAARKYRDIFEQIRKSVMDLVARGKHQSRQAVDMEAEVQEPLHTFDENILGNRGRDDFTHMINEMTGDNMNFGYHFGPSAASIGRGNYVFDSAQEQRSFDDGGGVGIQVQPQEFEQSAFDMGQGFEHGVLDYDGFGRGWVT